MLSATSCSDTDLLYLIEMLILVWRQCAAEAFDRTAVLGHLAVRRTPRRSTRIHRSSRAQSSAERGAEYELRHRCKCSLSACVSSKNGRAALKGGVERDADQSSRPPLSVLRIKSNLRLAKPKTRHPWLYAWPAYEYADIG